MYNYNRVSVLVKEHDKAHSTPIPPPGITRVSTSDWLQTYTRLHRYQHTVARIQRGH
jgi:hypothetical protein